MAVSKRVTMTLDADTVETLEVLDYLGWASRGPLGSKARDVLRKLLHDRLASDEKLAHDVAALRASLRQVKEKEEQERRSSRAGRPTLRIVPGGKR